MLKSIIVASAKNQVIGANHTIPWHLPNDLKFFKKTTLKHYVIMGRKTWESLPNGLANRNMIIITHNPYYSAPNCKIAASLKEALHIAKAAGTTEVFIAGGGTIYQEALPIVDQIYLTLVKAFIPGDTFFPRLDPSEWKEVHRIAYPIDAKHTYAYDFVKLVRKQG